MEVADWFHQETFQCTVQQLRGLRESDTGSYMRALWVDFLLCGVTVVILHPLSISFIMGSRPFPSKLKSWMVLYYVSDYMYLISFILTQLIHLTDRLGDRHGCALLIPANKCVFLRILQSYRLVFAHWFHITVLIDVQLEYFSRCYRNFRLSSPLLAILLILLVGYDVYPSIPVELGSTEMMVNCASFESKSSEVQFLHIFLPLLIADVAGLIIHGVWYIFQYFEKETPKTLLNAIDRKYFKNANSTFKITLPLFAVNFVSNLWHDIMSAKYSVDDKLSAAKFMSINTTPLCIFLSAILMFFIIHALANKALYHQIFFGRWCGVFCCKKNFVRVDPNPVKALGGTQAIPLRSNNWTGHLYARHM